MPTEPCPNAADHTVAPSGYLAWHEWAGRMYRAGWRQVKCEGCGLFKIWRGGRSLVTGGNE